MRRNTESIVLGGFSIAFTFIAIVFFACDEVIAAVIALALATVFSVVNIKAMG